MKKKVHPIYIGRKRGGVSPNPANVAAMATALNGIN